MDFDYGEAFSRNLGWVTKAEQSILRNKCIAIAGLGGVGGSHVLNAARLGVGGLRIADLDEFELANFNRQAGASIPHLGRSKVEVLSELARAINPELRLQEFPSGVDANNVDSFLDGVDIYIDALDFFALDARKAVFAACYRLGIPAITAAPIGMGSALLCFMPGGMSFEDYFRLEGHSQDEQSLRFMLGLTPALLQLSYIADPEQVDFKARKTPSTTMACELCAGIAGSWALKILLERGDPPVAPRGMHFDAYRNKLRHTWRPGGNNNLIQRLGLRIARRRVFAD